MLILLLLTASLYSLLILALILGFGKLKPPSPLKKETEIGFSVIVPFRNEAENLPRLLESFSLLNYPRLNFEIIMVDDHSEDRSVEICKNFRSDFPEFNIKILKNQRLTVSPKKDAINTGIENSNFEYIVTTDADCQVPENWLNFFASEIADKDAAMLAGPVAFSEPLQKKLFQRFEELDFYSLQGTSMGAFGIGRAFMCNGANLSYKRSAYEKVDGFRNNENITSGDDVFLLQKFKAAGLCIGFLKDTEAAVFTKYQKDLGSLISQRIRWGAKTPAYKDNFAKFIGLIVMLFNAFLIISAFLALFGLLNYQILLFVFLIKFNLDFVLIFKTADFFGRSLAMKDYFWISILHPFFLSFTAVLSFFSGFHWKGRKFRR